MRTRIAKVVPRARGARREALTWREPAWGRRIRHAIEALRRRAATTPLSRRSRRRRIKVTGLLEGTWTTRSARTAGATRATEARSTWTALLLIARAARSVSSWTRAGLKTMTIVSKLRQSQFRCEIGTLGAIEIMAIGSEGRQRKISTRGFALFCQ